MVLTVYSDEKKQPHIIGVEQHTGVVENHRYSVDKPNKTQKFFTLFFKSIIISKPKISIDVDLK
jgi:hypothetical protein